MINLFVNIYTDPHEERNKELSECAYRNLSNSWLTVHQISGRPTFQEFFDHINKVTGPDDINVIANSDIYFPVEQWDQLPGHNEVWALTRWDILPDGSERFYNNSGSQDCWIFRGKIRNIRGGEYTQGVAGCDNKIAFELEQAGYKITNPSLSIKTYHLHNSGVRHYNKGGKDIYRLPHPRKNVPITSLPSVSAKIAHTAVKKPGMTLLHFGLYNENEPQQSLRDALKGLCVNYIEHSWVNNPGNARKDFHRLMAEHNPDVVFMQVQTPDIIKASTLVRYPNVKIFNFNGDVRDVIPAWHFEIAPYCTTLFTNTDWVDVMLRKGFKARYCQVGFNDKIYTPVGRKAVTKPVVFLGNNHGSNFQLSPLRNEMIKRFAGKPWFQHYGRGYPGSIDLNYKQQEEAAVYRGAKIGINLSHMDLDCYTSDRMFRIMGSGALCLAYDHKGIRKEFENAYHLRTWSTLDELEHHILLYLSIEEDRIQIAKNGCDIVHSNYTWKSRFEKDLIPLL